MTEPTAFDAAAPLPSGLTAVEASAGTGKTYALAGLAVRYVAEQGVAAGELCIVSFTEAATAELRGRVRLKLVEALHHVQSGEPTTDAVLIAIADCADAERAERARRLRQAIVDFDAATVTTIHGFCTRVLASGDAVNVGIALSDGAAEIDEVVNDLVLAGKGPIDPDEMRPARLALAARMHLAMPDSELWIGDQATTPPRGAEIARRAETERAVELVREACVIVVERRRAARTSTFDGLLVDTRDLLQSSSGPTVIAALRARFRVVLIDEFQDTDTIQWHVFRTAFVGGADAASVVLVGDPKQSIYRFRGAELSAYLDATGMADRRHTLATSWRSDQPLLDSLDELFGDFEFGSPAVRFQQVTAAPGREHAAVTGAGEAPLHIRVVPRGDDDTLTAPQARRAVRKDLVAVVTELLRSGVTIDPPSGPSRPLHANDIAILTRSNADANSVAQMLLAAGVPAATASADSVLVSDAALQWRVLLKALERPGSVGAVRAAALGWFVGVTPEALDAYDADDVARLHDRMREWSSELGRYGVPRLLSLARAGGLQQRLLSVSGGERNLTDIDHIAELLQSAMAGRVGGAAGLLSALVELSDDVASSDVLARRIDRDDQAVHVLTVHRAKGLEFPVVLCPFMWTPTPGRKGIAHAMFEQARLLDGPWLANVPKLKWSTKVKDANTQEEDGEQRRLLYVALTRARHRVVLWWAPLTGRSKPSKQLLKVLSAAVGTDPVLPADFASLVGRADGNVTVRSVGDIAVRAASSVAAADRPTLEVATSSFVHDRAWRRWSFSSIKTEATRPTGVRAADIVPPTIGGADEPDEHAAPDTSADTSAVGSGGVLAAAPGGTDFGTMVHGIFEVCDFASATLHDDLVALCTEALRFRRRFRSISPITLATGMMHAIESPLGGALAGQRLRDVTRADRLDELSFDFHLGSFGAQRIGEVLVQHLAADDPVLAWARTVEQHGLQFPVSGTLNGSIDLMARSDGDRYWVADYKTNQLGESSRYTMPEMTAAMAHHDYPLQAALYLVALHRYLRWRLPGYEPGRNLVGAAYLFVRGMRPGPSVAEVPGVFWWQPPAAAIVALDALLATGEAT